MCGEILSAPDKVPRMEELLFRPALELAGMVRSGELSARELVSASLARIEALEPTINAFTHIAYDSAVRAAEAVQRGDPRPFAGVPIAVKDNRPVAGMPPQPTATTVRAAPPGSGMPGVWQARWPGRVSMRRTGLASG